MNELLDTVSGQFPERTFPQARVPRMTFARTDISPNKTVIGMKYQKKKFLS